MSRAKRRILCLDDDSDNNDLVRLLLEPDGYEVVAATKIVDALTLFEGGDFDLLIVDEKLPDGVGNDFCRKVRAADPTVPILIHSAAASKADIDEAMKAGADDYLIKPNGWAAIKEVVNKLMDRRP